MSNVLIATSLCLNLVTLILVVSLVLSPPKRNKLDITQHKSVSVIPLEKLYNGSVPVTVIANYGGRPWGNESQFIEPSAKWLWGTINDYPSWLFFTKFTIDSSSDIDAEIHLIIDQQGYAYIDGIPVLENKGRGWLTNDYAKEKVRLTPGEHIIAIYAENVTGTGGVICALMHRDGPVIVKTDKEWLCKKIVEKK